MPNILLPNIKRLELHQFSLYAKSPVVMDFEKEASCIMGANGIGKSTMLNCVNYAITGRINPPDKKLKSIEELDNGNDYHTKYFDGRIVESDKDFARVKIVFSLGKSAIELQRSFFPGKILSYILDGEEKQVESYKEDIVRLANLKNYAQFVFLQLKVLTFDESRDCLFWNPSILTPTIFLCLGQDVDNANRADELARKIQKINSRIRNVQWDITKQTTRLTTLVEERNKANEGSPQYTQEDEANAKNEYEAICVAYEQAESELSSLRKEQEQLYARITELTIEKIQLEKEYEEIYASLYGNQSYLRKNPIIIDLTTDGCPICHKVHTSIPACVEKSLEEGICPLCGDTISSHTETQDDVIHKLSQKDSEIAERTKTIEERVLRQEFVEEKIQILTAKLGELAQRKLEIEEKEYRFTASKDGDDAWAERISALNDGIKAVEEEKKRHISERDEIKVEYDRLCLELERIYNKVQVDFLPIFKKFAQKFTGLDLDMTLNSVSDDGRKLFKFALQIDDTNRDDEFELSESQRFFIDIALRMAIIDYVCRVDGYPTSMLIDTPEGSLDIAYETNAGSMFSEYINSNQKLIITANLNSSGLIKKLAENCRKTKFALLNMLTWAKLSSVQSSLYGLFDASIQAIEKLLEG